MKILKGEFKETGGNEIDIDVVIKYWNHLWFITERRKDHAKWRIFKSWKLIKQNSKDSNLIELRLTISPHQANELIERLDLKPYKATNFKDVYSWRRGK